MIRQLPLHPVAARHPQEAPQVKGMLLSWYKGKAISAWPPILSPTITNDAERACTLSDDGGG